MDYEKSNSLIGLFIGVTVGIMVLTGFTMPVIHKHQIARDKFEAAIENGYTAYLDGDEVDISKLDTYNVSVARTAVLESPSQNAIILSGGKHYGQKKKLQLE